MGGEGARWGAGKLRRSGLDYNLKKTGRIRQKGKTGVPGNLHYMPYGRYAKEQGPAGL
jgi:hypothetical protein